VYRPGHWLTGNYWDEMLTLSLAGTHAPPRSVAILGDAAGTSARQIGHYFPQARVDAVEIDGALTKVGRQLFDLSGPRLHTHTADARPWLYASSRRFDVILVDAYRQPYIPFYLTTQEFFALAKAHLAPGGVLVVNSAHPPGSTTLEKVLTATLRTVFGHDHVWRDPSEATNTTLIADTGADPRTALRTAADQAPPDLAGVLRRTAGSTTLGLDGGAVYTDDRAPVEWLIDFSLAEQAG
jgi:spermidine synthase